MPADDDPVLVWHRWWCDRVAGLRHDPRHEAARTGFVLTTAELARHGISRSAARHAVRTGRWTGAGHGAVAPVRCRPVAGAPSHTALVARREHALRAAAAARARPDHVVSGSSAAILHGLPTMRVPDRVELTARDAEGSGDRQRAHVFVAGIRRPEVTDWFGIPVTTVARTLVDLARHSRRDGIVAADAALRTDLVTARAVDRALRGATGWPGVRQARAVLAVADRRAESPLESITRLALLDDGLGPLELQLPVGPYYADIALPERGLLVEADGRVKYRTASGPSDDDPLWDEKQREQALRRHGWWVERVTWFDITVGWRATRERLRASPRRLPVAPSPPPWS